MAEIRQKMRGSTAALDGYTGAEGQLLVDLSRLDLRVYDGIAAGGQRIPNLTHIEQNFLKLSTGGTIAGAVTIEGVFEAAAGINATGAFDVVGAVTLEGSVAVDGEFTVTGAGSIAGLLSAEAGLEVTGALGVSGATTLEGLLTASAGIAVTGALVTSGGVTSGGTLTASSNAAVTGTLTTTGAATVGGLLTANDALQVTGLVTATGAVSAGVSESGGVSLTYDDGHAYLLNIGENEIRFTIDGELDFIFEPSGALTTAISVVRRSAGDSRYHQLSNTSLTLGTLSLSQAGGGARIRTTAAHFIDLEYNSTLAVRVNSNNVNFLPDFPPVHGADPLTPSTLTRKAYVDTAIADATTGVEPGSVGSVMFVRVVVSGVTRTLGQTISGSQLVPCGVTSSGLSTSGSALTGTWQVLGFLPELGATLAKRIS